MQRDFNGFIPPPRFQPKEKPAKQVAAPSQSELIERAVEVLKSCKRNSAKVDQLRLLFGVRVHKNKSRKPHNKAA